MDTLLFIKTSGTPQAAKMLAVAEKPLCRKRMIRKNSKYRIQRMVLDFGTLSAFLFLGYAIYDYRQQLLTSSLSGISNVNVSHGTIVGAFIFAIGMAIIREIGAALFDIADCAIKNSDSP